jgi:hypothetical protein
MRTLLRRRVIVPAAVAVVLVAVATGTAWYLLGEERRMGSTIERVLAGRTGLPITIQRASWNGSRLRLRDVRLPADPGRPIDVRIGQLDVDAPLMTLVSPAGRTISLVATAVSVTLTAPDATGAGGIEPLRTGLLAFLGWSAMLRWRSEGTELRAPGGALTLDLAGEKRGTGLTASITLVPSAGGEPLRLDVRGAAALGRSVDLAVDLTGPPDVIAGLLPDVALPASAVSGRVQLQLVAGGVVSASGRLSLEANAPKPTALDFAARYDSASGSLGVSRYTLRWRDDVRLTGAARLERSDRARRLTVTAEGDAADAKVKATLGYELDGGAFEADVEADALDADRARRFGLDVPLEIHARGVHARVAGRVSPDMVIARVDATAAQVSSALRQSVPVGASVRATVSVARGADGLRVRSVQDGKLGLTREGAPLLTATVASPPTAPWPLAIAVSVADLGRAAPLLPVPAVLSGSAQLKGSLAAARPPTFRGTVDARLPRARLEAGGPIELSEVRLEAPSPPASAAIRLPARSASRV